MKSELTETNNFKVRTILKFGATIFGFSSILLILLPGLFLDLLDLDSTSNSLIWSMRMIGITLVALAGNMWLNSHQTDVGNLRRTAILMCVCATSLGIITLFIPADLNWFSILYALVGFGFGLAYLVALATKRF